MARFFNRDKVIKKTNLFILDKETGRIHKDNERMREATTYHPGRFIFGIEAKLAKRMDEDPSVIARYINFYGSKQTVPNFSDMSFDDFEAFLAEQQKKREEALKNANPVISNLKKEAPVETGKIVSPVNEDENKDNDLDKDESKDENKDESKNEVVPPKSSQPIVTKSGKIVK